MLPVPTGRGTGLALNPDGSRLATASDFGRLQVWDLRERKPIRAIPIHVGSAAVGSPSVAWSPDGRMLAGIAKDQNLTLWDAGSGEVLRKLDNAKAVGASSISAIGFRPDSRGLAAASWSLLDRVIKIWDLPDGRSPRILRGHQRPILALAFRPDGRRLASAGGDMSGRADAGEVLIWDAESGRRIRSMPVAGVVQALAYSRDGKALASSGPARSLLVWDPEADRPPRTLAGHAGDVTSLAFHPDARHLASAGADPPARIWDLADDHGPLVRRLPQSGQVAKSLAFSPDGRWLLGRGSDTGRVYIWPGDVGEARARPTRELSGPRPVGVATGRGRTDGRLRVVGLPSGRVEAEWPAHSGMVWWAEFVGTDTFVSMGRDKVRITDAATGRERASWPSMLAATLDPGRRWLATADRDRHLRLIEVSTGRETRTIDLPGKSVYELAYSPDGGRLAAFIGGTGWPANDRTAVWSTRDGGRSCEVDGGLLAILADDRGLITGRFDGTVLVSDPADGRIRFEFRGHDGPVEHAVLSPDGARLLTAGATRRSGSGTWRPVRRFSS